MSTKKIHIIAIGGAAMHNIALDLHAQGHQITGSDDEIYEPSLGRLQRAGIAPESFGWYPEKITSDLDFVILGMHARIDNPEVLKAEELGIKVYSYPEFVYEQSQDKKRVVIAGSHGKTTTTAIIMHVLKKCGIRFDYLVGAQLDGFDRMVQLTDAPLIIIEGDEYLSSAPDRIPKIHHYYPHIAVITGIAWDHINVFPTFENYIEQFNIFCHTIKPGGTLIHYQHDDNLTTIVQQLKDILCVPYGALTTDHSRHVIFGHHQYPVSIIGQHNLQNLNAARLVCSELGVGTEQFFEAVRDFHGANKRLQKISDKDGRMVYLDFAHAPSKVQATTRSFKAWFIDRPLLAVLELHTFSSLNHEFITQYRDTLQAADHAIVFYNKHTLKMKNMPDLDPEFIQECFHHPDLKVVTDAEVLHTIIEHDKESHILLMTSGNFNKMPLDF
ncbi:MAG: Mur ligase domain-containing protein [Chitinophagales bacterium]|nr:Mur ligase domain-containing protein [Chitinophagales bacterium]